MLVYDIVPSDFKFEVTISILDDILGLKVGHTRGNMTVDAAYYIPDLKTLICRLSIWCRLPEKKKPKRK